MLFPLYKTCYNIFALVYISICPFCYVKPDKWFLLMNRTALHGHVLLVNTFVPKMSILKWKVHKMRPTWKFVCYHNMYYMNPCYTSSAPKVNLHRKHPWFATIRSSSRVLTGCTVLHHRTRTADKTFSSLCPVDLFYKKGLLMRCIGLNVFVVEWYYWLTSWKCALTLDCVRYKFYIHLNLKKGITDKFHTSQVDTPYWVSET